MIEKIRSFVYRDAVFVTVHSDLSVAFANLLALQPVPCLCGGSMVKTLGY